MQDIQKCQSPAKLWQSLAWRDSDAAIAQNLGSLDLRHLPLMRLSLR
jgi:hypothetical protein